MVNVSVESSIHRCPAASERQNLIPSDASGPLLPHRFWPNPELLGSGTASVENVTASASGVARLKQTGRGVLKAGVRLTGTASSGLRPPPDFLVIGAKRGGTTSFYYDLLEHPGVVRLFPPPVLGLKSEATKGVHYFDTQFFRGERWYRSYMPTAATRRRVSTRYGLDAVTGEASPFYLFHPAAAARAHATVPEARIIALLRDPVTRTYSHWKERRRNGMEALDFLDALDAEDSRISGERERLLDDPSYISYAWEQESYAAQSRYAESLRPWVELFGRDHVFVAASEDYYAQPDRVLGDVHEFLGLPRKATATGSVRNAAAGAPLPPELQAELHRRFADSNQALALLLGQTFPWT